MTLAEPAANPGNHPSAAGARVDARPGAATTAGRIRDPRLDFFRGIAMFIILIAHTPDNWLTLWIPARFGFSDATEIFVFCSGMASAIAFGTVFRTRGWPMGTARVIFRCWQIYWVHIALFVATAATMAALNASGWFSRDYVGELNLYPFFNAPLVNLPALLTLTYVPNYFDILPMYFGVMLMMPLVVALARVHTLLAAGGVVGLWLTANLVPLDLPAEPWSDRVWFFNPFGWALVFYTGFAFMAGWLRPPPVSRTLAIVAALVLLATVPFAYYRVHGAVPYFADWRGAFAVFFDKTDFGILRYVHFLSLAYLAWAAAGAKGHRLLPPDGAGHGAQAWRTVLAVIMKVGQQSLAVFVASMYLARLMGVALDTLGRTHATMLLVNAAGAAIVIAVAYGAGWFKTQPWRRRAG